MSPEAREQLRLSTLRFLDANNTRFGMAAPLILQMARAEGRPSLTQSDLDSELDYLIDKGLITEILKVLSPENKAFRITATGRDFLAQN